MFLLQKIEQYWFALVIYKLLVNKWMKLTDPVTFIKKIKFSQDTTASPQWRLL